jgi:hypothetical protein
VEEAGSEEACGRRGGGRDWGRADLRRHRHWAPTQEARSGGERGASTNNEVHAGEGGGGRRAAGRRCAAVKSGPTRRASVSVAARVSSARRRDEQR